jgi:transcriptional regulator with XRE-family HTH domain
MTNPPTRNTARAVVRTYLESIGRNQNWLAGKMRIPASTLSNILMGLRRPTPEFLERLHDATGGAVDIAHAPKSRSGFYLRNPPAAAAIATVEDQDQGELVEK